MMDNRAPVGRILVVACCVLLVLLALGSVGVWVGAQEAPPTPETAPTPSPAATIPHTLIARSHCLVCHETGFGDAKKVPDDHVGYTNEECMDCHAPSVISEEIPIVTPGPGEVPKPLEHPPGDGANSCYDCHVLIDEKHAQIADEWEKSVHGQANVGCADCHGGDPRSDEMNVSMDPKNGFIGVPPRVIVPEICGGCHSDPDRMRQYGLNTDQYLKYVDSVHGKRLKEEGDTRVAICTDCHGVHDIQKASDPASPVYSLNIPDLCAGCHADPKRMEPYGIPTDQYDLYKISVHGKALLEKQDLRAASCVSCHGSHGAKPPESEEVINVCGKCHAATQKYYNESRHAKIGKNGPKCVTCHGEHDIFPPTDDMFVHPEGFGEERHCGTCHINEKEYRWDKSWFARPEDRRCDTCHHQGSMIMPQVLGLQRAIVEAVEAYNLAEEAIKKAQALGMIVLDAEAKLTEARTSIVSARATLHTTKLTIVGKHTDAAKEKAQEAYKLARQKIEENLFRRKAMVVAIIVIGINIMSLYLLKRQLEYPE